MSEIPQRRVVQWAMIERGYEADAAWTVDRSEAEADLFSTMAGGSELDVFLATREVLEMPWREVAP